MRTHLIHRPARDISPRLVELEFPPIALDPERPHAAAASLVHLNSLPSVQMRCIITAKRRPASSPIRLKR